MNNKQSFFQKNMHLITAGVVFIVLAIVYCSPVLQGKIILAGDSINGRAAVQESVNYHETTGNRTFWTNSMFGGMPNYQIGGGQTFSEKFTAPVLKVMRWGHRNQIFILLFYFIAFYALMRTFGVNKWVSIAGAVAIGLSSYFLIIIAASHNGKCSSIAWMTMVLAGMMLIFKRKYFLGAITVMFFLLAGFTPHPQMSYYMGMLIGLLYFAEIYIHIKEKKIKDLLIGTAIFAAAFVVGVGTESGRIFANAEYTEQTMRGGHSELVKDNDATNKTTGLDLDYATQWSYGIDESFTFLIPNFMGASSNYSLGENSYTYKALIDNRVPRASAREFAASVPTYWGTQPFTAGPVYMGAIVIFLFILSLFVVKNNPYKWALLAATVFSVLLSWGHNFMWLTKLFFDYFPMYDKFRAVSSILIVAEITIPLLGFLALKAIMEKQIAVKKLLKYIQISAGITGGICLFFALFGGAIYSFSSPNDAQMFAQLPAWLSDAIVADRAAMMRGDAWRSLLFIVLTMALLWLFVKEKIKFAGFAAILGVLILVDMWTVDKRFLNDDNFKPARGLKDAFVMQPYEKYLLETDTTYYRVLNLTASPFNDARTSYYLKSIGGYSAAKLQHYQDLIDQHISKMNMNVLNMLNTKYVITKQGEQIMPQLNPDAFGNAWFIDSLKIVNTPNEESDALNTLNLRNTAVLDRQFADFTTNFVAGHDSTAAIALTKYTPEYVEYDSKSAKDGTVVFSEIYYPYGWKAYIDGKPTEHFRVNYMLRALNIPAGEHHIRFEFRPDSIKKGDRLALASLGILAITILAGAGWGIWNWRKINYSKLN